jgi:hypothetical protein
VLAGALRAEALEWLEESVIPADLVGGDDRPGVGHLEAGLVGLVVDANPDLPVRDVVAYRVVQDIRHKALDKAGDT